MIDDDVRAALLEVMHGELIAPNVAQKTALVVAEQLKLRVRLIGCNIGVYQLGPVIDLESLGPIGDVLTLLENITAPRSFGQSLTMKSLLHDITETYVVLSADQTYLVQLQMVPVEERGNGRINFGKSNIFDINMYVDGNAIDSFDTGIGVPLNDLKQGYIVDAMKRNVDPKTGTPYFPEGSSEAHVGMASKSIYQLLLLR